MKLGSATILGQVLGIIVMPILSRLYTPADFGIYQLFCSLVALIASFSCLSYSSAINMPKKHEDAANIVILSLLLIIITSIVTTVFFFSFSGYIDQVLKTPGLSNYFFLLPLAIICNGFAFVLGYWLSRKEEFGTIAKANLISSISGKAVSVGSGLQSPSPFGLIFGTIINDATILIFLLRKTATDFHYFKEVSFEKIRQLAYRYKKFPQYNLSANLVSSAAGQCTPFLLAYFFSPIIVGYYAMSFLIVNLPLKLVGNSFVNVFYQKICAEKNVTGNIKNIVKSVHTRLISIGMFGCLIVMIIGPELFTFVLGNQWYTAGVYAQILTPFFFVLFISVPLLSILNVMEKQNINLWFNLYALLSNIFILIIGGLSGDPIIFMLLLSANSIVTWSWMNMYILKIVGVSRLDAVHEIFRYLLFGLFISLPLLIAKYYAIPSTILILIAIGVSAIYYLIIVYQDTELKKGLVNFIGDIRQK
jgi:O-antigen/teichoic acid export membrane protein